MALSAAEIESIYLGQARYILAESDQGLRLQLPAVNFHSYVTGEGIRGRFKVKVDASDKILTL